MNYPKMVMNTKEEKERRAKTLTMTIPAQKVFKNSLFL